MEWYWILIITAILLFCFWVVRRRAFGKGYKAGAEMVLKQWKEELYLKDGES